MRDCMKMEGGGPFKLGSGQVTDDSELAMCVMRGILNSHKDQVNKDIEQAQSITSRAIGFSK